MQVQEIRPRKGGKTAQFALNLERSKRIRKDPVEPMHNDARAAGYMRQHPGRPFTRAELKRLADHQLKCTADRDCTPDEAQWQVRGREYRRKPIQQRFNREPMIDNQHLPTGRVGMARFGPAAGIEGLNKLLFGSRKGEKGMDLGQSAAASQAGRFAVRTAHGRRKGAGRRYSSRGR